jgi:phosphoglycolate phosphatase-like HAD superfamily hydrolase
MSDAARPLILDADGVFLSERPYWNAALGTALEANGLAGRAMGRWDALADYAFGPVGLQRVTKVAGCNSNWDLAAVLVRALGDETWRGVVDEMLAADDREIEAMQSLRTAARCLFYESPNGSDPLEQFGITRGSAFFEDVVDLFQKVLYDDAGLGWSYEAWQLKESWPRTGAALGALRDAGYTLRVCTGRNRHEIESPIRALDLEPFLPFSEITSADEIERAEAISGRRGLGKPHWFGPACATVGFEVAIEALARPRALSGSGVYAGDAWADFRAVESCRGWGLDLAYVHVRSGVTTREQEREIADSAGTVGVVSSLVELLPLLRKSPS